MSLGHLVKLSGSINDGPYSKSSSALSLEDGQKNFFLVKLVVHTSKVFVQCDVLRTLQPSLCSSHLFEVLLLDAPEVIAGLRHWPSAESRGVARECHTSANISIVIPRVDEL